MVFVRGNRKNYDDWAAAGCTGWSHADVLPSFRRMEDWEDGATALRGSGGPVKVTRQKDLTPASLAFIEALAATAGVKEIDDYNGESQEGMTVCPQNASGGLRYSSSVGYLDQHSLPNLTVTTGALITGCFGTPPTRSPTRTRSSSARTPAPPSGGPHCGRTGNRMISAPSAALTPSARS
ncbi:MAG TPA: GMC family oxidoreductase N-terminal domain-containing protein [Streptosporangiaceae bacterium]|nr:GMC family oxidoreductase N-terminal domain-containing protein [Streptosporangiaceae bacterium]